MIMRQERRSSRRVTRIPRQGNFHMSLPQVLKIKLTALDSSIMAVGFGRGLGAFTVTNGGAQTRAGALYDIFYPTGTYIDPGQPGATASARVLGASNAGGNLDVSSGSQAWIIPGSWDGTATGLSSRSDETKINVLPGQMTSFAALYKLARVERVDFHFKITNLGPSSITGQADGPTSLIQSNASGALNHLIAVLPQSHWTNSLTPPGFLWSPNSSHSDHNASQLAELPGSITVSSSQDGNREVIHIRKSVDCAARQAGDPIRQATWMQSDDVGSEWIMPPRSLNDPVLGSIATSPIVDQILNSGSSLNVAQRNCWFRYNEHVSVQYHLTFWDPKTPQITFT